MSCQWRQKSHDSWEMTLSNPPSELPNDPIISTSSNPDERSSSPATRSEKSQSFRAASETQIGDSLFSNAAQEETEPIPRDSDMPSPEDMLIVIPDSPSNSSLKSDIDDHISSLRSEQPQMMEHPKPDPKTRHLKEKASATKPDPEDDAFELSESGRQESDSSYVGETSRRLGKKKAPGKSMRGKATGKLQPVTKSNTQNTSATIKGSKKVTAQKGRPQKKDMTTKAASKRSKPVNKEKKSEQPDEVIPNSQPLPIKNQANRVQPVTRISKKSFFTELENGKSTQATQIADTKTQPKPNSGIIAGKKQSSNNRDHIPPASPIRACGDDVWYLPGSPEKQDHNPLPKVQSKKRISPTMPGVAVGPNSKKKRSPVQSGPAQRNIKKSTTRNYGQKPAHHLGGSEFFDNRKDQEAQHKEQPKPTEAKQSSDQNVDSSDQGLDPVPNNSVHIEIEKKEVNKKNLILPKSSGKPAPEATTTDQVPKLGMNTAQMSPGKRVLPNPPEADAKVIPEKQSRPSAPIPNNTNKQTTETGFQTSMVRENSDGLRESGENLVLQSKTTDGSLSNFQVDDFLDDHLESASQEVPDRIEHIKEDEIKRKYSPAKRTQPPLPVPLADSDQQKTRMSDEQKNPGKFDICLNQPQRDLNSSEMRYLCFEESDDSNQRHETPVQIATRSMVSELGSPSRPSKAAAGNLATFQRSLLQEPRQPTNYEEQFKLPARPQVPFDNSMPRPLQMTSDFESRLVQANVPLPASHIYPQALEHLDNYKPISRAVLSPSSSVKRPAKHTEDIVPQALQLHPKSIDFARRVAEGQKQTDYSKIDEGPHGMANHQSAKELPWPQPKSAVGLRDASRLSPSKVDDLGDFFGQSVRGHGRKSREQTSKPDYETKWREAVDEASEGVVDTLHFISTNLLEHLRTRDESIIAVVEEYKRNGAKVSERLSKRQIGEWLQASTTAKQKCLELATVYGELSGKAQDLRSKCLSKHRSQAYAEWQRQITRIRGAVRAAREEATLG
ncbi:hypothetical protein F4781DRAFT_251142 [Annulohypoxylon bovei var. microspora]|nr:hypothetical protein F4781DRAFT_251142 [Annulohypoxylon bovei var. microspora]